MNMKTQESFEEKIVQLLVASPKNSSKGDPLKDWFKDCFHVHARVARITEDKQLGNRITEQFTYKDAYVVFVIEPSVNAESLVKKIKERQYKELNAVLIVVADGAKPPYVYKTLIARTQTDVTKWMEETLEVTVDSIGKPGAMISFENMSLQQITYGAPGTGKSYGVKKEVVGESVIRTTFHPDSDYATFVGAYKPTMEFAPRTFMKGEEITKVAKGDASLLEEKRIVYKFVPQAFLQAYEKAWKFKVDAAQKGVTAKRQYLVIEEINRGNCAQIFGDLFQLLDRNDAGFSDYEIVADEDLRRHLAEKFVDAAKANEATPLDLGIDPVLAERVLAGEALLLPDNLFIRATMNTSDQSLFPIDSAFKRRWDWKYVPISDAGKGWKIEVDGLCYSWWDFLVEANKLVQEVTESEDKKLGYFFVKAKGDVVTLEQFVGKVVFYLWNDVFKNGDLPSVLAESGDGGFAFGKFFKNDGKPNGAVVKAFLEKLGLKEIAAGGGTPALPDDGASA